MAMLTTGCNNGKSPPGGPGASNAKTGPMGALTLPENAFRLDPPNLATSIKQGESKNIRIGIDRGKNFDQDVKMEFAGAPKGVTVKPAGNELKAGDKEMVVTVDAAKDAALGEHAIAITGTPAKDGAKTSTSFKIDVKKTE
jgi:uncharacterized membrane protein